MCRFVAYLGPRIRLDELLYKPHNSLIHQSYHALERSDPVNGDGFGVGFYVPEVDPEPVVFVSTQPAWNNRNLRQNAPKFMSGCILAHVRAASSSRVSEDNCHPFRFGRMLLMHNGDIAGFRHLKQLIVAGLSHGIYEWISGGTDTEHFFAMVLDRLPGATPDHASVEEIVGAVRRTIADLAKLQDEMDVEGPTYLNLCISDGRALIATRYCSDPRRMPPSLHYSEGSRYECVDGACRMIQSDGSERAVIVSSERLTQEDGVFQDVPPNHFLTVAEDGRRVSVFPV